MKRVIIIGGGIAGCSTAYFLKEAGYKVILFEKDTICSGGSYAAGAFLSPKLSKPSRYKDYLNTALKFSLKFYQERFPKLFKRVPLYKYPKDKEDWKKLQSYEEYIDFPYQKREGYYKLDFAGIVEPQELCYEMLKNIDFHENSKIEDLTEFKGSTIIIAHPNQKYFHEPYLRTKEIGGYRYDVLFDECENRNFNSHKDCSISCYFRERIAIGATYIRGMNNLEELAKCDSENLLQKGQNLHQMQNISIKKHYTGFRNMTYDFFPIIGSLINSYEILKKYPYIKKGSKVPSEKYIYHEDIYIHTALGSRGFVYAPYNAKLLLDLIVNSQEIPDFLNCTRLFKKYAQKRLSD